MNSQVPFQNTYARLPERFFAKAFPTRVAAPELIKVNAPLARQLQIDPEWLAGEQGVAMLAGNRLPDGAEPIAMAYAGHQFGGFVPQLGDGRAILLGEVIGRDGMRRDIQLKGAGPTLFSRRGDGRAALGPVLREFVISEAMSGLGIPTTRALAAVRTGEQVMRDTMLPGAVFTRVAASHVRVGTFQYFAARGDVEGVRTLADYVLARHYPGISANPRPYRALLDAVIRAQAELIARWLLVGFIHGVMNTDNMSVSGETIDYGPCAFMDTYDPATVYSAIDQYGRYAYANQPAIAQWNLTRLAECLLPLLAEDKSEAIAQAEEALDAFQKLFDAAHRTGFRRKLGLTTEEPDDDMLGRGLMDFAAANHADFTLTFRRLSEAAGDASAEVALRELFTDGAGLDRWLAQWRERLAREDFDPRARATAMKSVNPAVIPRNHRMEAVIRAAVNCEDYAPFEEFIKVLENPFQDQPAFSKYAEPPKENEIVHQTFCGT